MGWDTLVEDALARHPGAKASQMFGTPCLKRENGKVAFCFWRGDIAFKLVDSLARESALELDGATLFDPGMGRAMKEWVLVPATHSQRWPEFDALALA